MAKKVREYSRDFTPRKNADTGSYSMHKIPMRLLKDVKAKAKREGVSLRAMFLRRMSEYLEETAQ